MKTSLKEFKDVAELVMSNDVYEVYDLKLDKLVVSVTELHPGKETRGHSHANVEEIYFFLEGEGEMQPGEENFAITKDDLVIVEPGKFHKVFNKGEANLRFLVIFEKYERE